MILDGEDQVLGRFSSKVAELLLEDEEVKIVNSSKLIITGNPRKIIDKYIERRSRGDPHHGPYYPKEVERILRRTIRGMLPYKKKRGKEAMKRLKIYEGNPLEEKGKKIAKDKNNLTCRSISLEEISKRLKGRNK